MSDKKIFIPRDDPNDERDEDVKEQFDFWHHMDDMMGVHLVEAAEMILNQKDQKLWIDSIDDTVTKIMVLQNLLHTFLNQDSDTEMSSSVPEFEDIELLRAGTNAKDVDKVESAYMSMLARSQINKEDEEHE